MLSTLILIAAGFTTPTGLHEALDAALADERHAAAFYEAVMEVHGKKRPFSNIVLAERRHESMVLGLYPARQWTAPLDTWKKQDKESKDDWLKRMAPPKTFGEAAKAAWQAEVDNVKLYDAWLKDELPADVKAVFTKLRDDSRDKHLPAFARWKDR